MGLCYFGVAGLRAAFIDTSVPIDVRLSYHFLAARANLKIGSSFVDVDTTW